MTGVEIFNADIIELSYIFFKIYIVFSVVALILVFILGVGVYLLDWLWGKLEQKKR